MCFVILSTEGPELKSRDMKTVLAIWLCCLWLFATPVAMAQESVAADPETAQIDWVAEVVKGGITSAVLVLVAVAGLAFTIERLLVVTTRKFVPGTLVRRLRPLTREGRLDEVARITEGDPSMLGRVASYIARHVHLPYDILAIGAADLGAREIRRQLQRTYPLAVVATLSPLLGLLGTIIGMIEAFQKVALMGDTGDASVLADSIGKALITTALGLVIAIPALGFYHFFKSRISQLGNLLEEEVDEILALWLKAPHLPEVVQAAESAAEAEDGPVEGNA